jgi:hypothetical protein
MLAEASPVMMLDGNVQSRIHGAWWCPAGTADHKLWLYDVRVGRRPQVDLSWGSSRITDVQMDPRGEARLSVRHAMFIRRCSCSCNAVLCTTVTVCTADGPAVCHPALVMSAAGPV